MFIVCDGGGTDSVPGCSNCRSIRSCTGQPYHKESRRRLQRAVKAHNRENEGYVHDVSHMANPLEWYIGGELAVVDVGTFVGQHPFPVL